MFSDKLIREISRDAISLLGHDGLFREWFWLGRMVEGGKLSCSRRTNIAARQLTAHITITISTTSVALGTIMLRCKTSWLDWRDQYRCLDDRCRVCSAATLGF